MRERIYKNTAERQKAYTERKNERRALLVEYLDGINKRYAAEQDGAGLMYDLVPFVMDNCDIITDDVENGRRYICDRTGKTCKCLAGGGAFTCEYLMRNTFININKIVK